MRLLAALVVSLFAGCDGSPGRVAIPVTSSTLDPGDPAVVAIGIRRVACAAPLAVHCSGTLIAPRIVLTAAHCIADPRLGGELEVLFGSDANAPDARIRRVIQTAIHPAYQGDGDEADLAVLVIDQEGPVAPVPLASLPFDQALVGQSVRVVGFGQPQAGGNPPGVKRSGTSQVSALSANQFVTAPAPSLSCTGDSGGPVFGREGTQEVLIGVTSQGDPGCQIDGRNVRVDRYAAEFILPWVTSTMLPSPREPGPIALGALCSAPCASDADCPQGLACRQTPSQGGLVSRCIITGLLSGSIGETCTSDSQCDERCVRLRPDEAPDACRCFRSCDTSSPTPSRGCSAGGTTERDSSAAGLSLGVAFCAFILIWLTQKGLANARQR